MRLTFYQCKSLPTSSWFWAKPLSLSVKLKPVPTFTKYSCECQKRFTDTKEVLVKRKYSLDCQHTGWNNSKSTRNPSIPLQKTQSGKWENVPTNSPGLSCMGSGARALLTSHVLVHHIGTMFHKEAKHRGATRSTLQPEENWGLLPALSARGEHVSSAPPSGDFTSLAETRKADHSKTTLL